MLSLCSATALRSLPVAASSLKHFMEGKLPMQILANIINPSRITILFKVFLYETIVPLNTYNLVYRYD